MNEYTDISGEYNIGNDTAEANITYIAIDLQSSILQRMLNPSTKEIAKIESNKIQKVELIRWDVATKLQIYASSNNTDVLFKNIRRRPTINPIQGLEGTQPLEILKTKLNKAHQEYQQTAQTISK